VGRRHSDRLAAIVEHCDAAVIAQTLDGIVTSWNPATERMYGYTAREVTGKSIDLLSAPGQAGEMHTILARIRAGQPVERLEATRLRKDGSALYSEGSGSRVNVGSPARAACRGVL
jgi:PAS domain S-box-containing protein